MGGFTNLIVFNYLNLLYFIHISTMNISKCKYFVVICMLFKNFTQTWFFNSMVDLELNDREIESDTKSASV